MFATKLHVDQNKILKTFTEKINENLGVFSACLLNDDGCAQELASIDEQIKCNMASLERFPANAKFYSKIV
jgi:hypothetical protein